MYMCSPLAYTHLESQVPVVLWIIYEEKENATSRKEEDNVCCLPIILILVGYLFFRVDQKPKI